MEVIVRRTQYDLRKALERAHILIGLLIALDYIDKVIALIRASKTPKEARQGLMEGAFIEDKDKFWEKFSDLIEYSRSHDPSQDTILTEVQAKAILEMRLQKLTGLERDKVKGEFEELQKKISHLRAILDDEQLRYEIIKTELAELKEKFGDERRTEISYADGEISIEDLIKNEKVVITISNLGYIKRTPVAEYRTQSRGGRGSRGSKTRDTDFIENLFVAKTHNYLLLFTEKGKCHWLRVYEIPEASKTSSGRAIQNILSIPKEEQIKAYIRIKDLKDVEFLNSHYIMFSTIKGQIKKTAVEAFSRPRAGGINAITINEGDQLLAAKLTNGENEVFLASNRGMAIRFHESKVRAMGRNAAGVRGISLRDPNANSVIGMICIDPSEEDKTVLVVSAKGNGKRSEREEYRLTNRGGKGVKTMQVTDKTGDVVSIKQVSEEDDLMITTKLGIVIRMPVSDIRIMGRATQGVRVIRLDEGEDIADVGVVPLDEVVPQEEEVSDEDNENTEDA